MDIRWKHLFFLFFFLVLLLFSLPALADHPQDGNHDLAEMPADCVVCHNSEGGTHFSVVGEHRFRLGTDNHRLCAYCHYNPDSPFFDDPTFPWDDDPDLAVAITFGRRNTNPRGYIEPVYCAYCHVTENRSTHIHSGEHDHAEVPLSCQGCHGENLKEAHIAPLKNLPDEADLPDSTSPEYAEAYEAGLSDLKLSCYTCHGETVIGTSTWDLGKVYFQQDPVVRAAVAAGIAGSDITCDNCHGSATHVAQHDHAVISSPDCLNCHSANVVTEHVSNHGLSCATCHSSTDQVVIDAIVDGSGPSGTDVDCNVCHVDVDHSTAHDQVYLLTRENEVLVNITSTDDPADGTYDNLPPFRPSDTCGACHRQVAENHWGNFHSGLRMLELLDQQGNPIPRGTWDPVRPWILGPGMFGNWCPGYQRQLADMTAVFADESEFLAKVDMSAFEFIQECGVCHVGGGVGDLNPYGYDFPSLHYEHDNAVRAAALATDALNGNHDLVPLNAWDFQVKDGAVVQTKWFEESGVLDVDCLMCHLVGYKHLARNEQITRYAKFKNAATLGTGVADPDSTVADVFDYNEYYVSRDAQNRLYLNSNFARNIKRIPPAENCLACHMPEKLEFENEAIYGDLWKDGFLAAEEIASDDPGNPDPLVAANQQAAVYRNDYLKRGDTWKGDEVHKVLQCGGCHSETAKFKPVDQHSPGKGLDPLKFPSDHDETVKTCEDCHLLYGDLDGDGVKDMEHYGPPEMQIKHLQAGLLAEIVPTARQVIDAAGTEEEFPGNHLDIISCTACHIQKRYTAARSVDVSTGSRFYNLVGIPTDLPPTGEEIPLAYTWKENTRSKVIDGEPNPEWRRKIYPFNYLTSIYWDNVGATDANGDGYVNGADNAGHTVIGDPFFLRKVKEQFLYQEVNDYNNKVSSGLLGESGFDEMNEWAMTTQAGSIMFTQPAEIDAFQAKLSAVDGGYSPQLKLESQPFLLTHSVMPTTPRGISGGDVYALGTPTRDLSGTILQYGCNDCHGGSDGIFNGSYDLLGSGLRTSDGSKVPITISWNAGDVSTSALYWDKEGTSSLLDFTAGTQTRVPERNEFLGYDLTRVNYLNTINATDYGIGVDPVADIVSINGINADGTIIEVVVGSTVEMIAAAAGSGGIFDYRWTVNDDGLELLGQTVQKTFAQTGLWTVMLTVIDEENNLVQNSQQVSVIPPGPSTVLTYTATAGSPVVTLALSNLPTHDLIKFYFGDGTRQYISDSGSTYTLQRNYRLQDKYLNSAGDVWEYNTFIRIYNAGDWVETINVQVVIPVN